jgi:hypothetical protein
MKLLVCKAVSWTCQKILSWQCVLWSLLIDFDNQGRNCIQFTPQIETYLWSNWHHKVTRHIRKNPRAHNSHLCSLERQPGGICWLLLHYSTAVAAWWVVNLLQQHSNLFSSLFPPSIHFKKIYHTENPLLQNLHHWAKKVMYLYLHLDWWELMEASGLSLLCMMKVRVWKQLFDFFFHL